MDDPLIGLTIYDTTKSYDSSSSQRSDGSGKDGTVSTNGTQSGVVGEGEGVDDTHEDCFPCLPSLPDNQEKKKADASTSHSRLESDSDTIKMSQHCIEHEERDLPASHLTSQPKNFWLMRLFQSSLFNMSIAIGYLFNSKDPTVQSYLGSRLFVSIVRLMFSKSSLLYCAA